MLNFVLLFWLHMSSIAMVNPSHLATSTISGLLCVQSSWQGKSLSSCSKCQQWQWVHLMQAATRATRITHAMTKIENVVNVNDVKEIARRSQYLLLWLSKSCPTSLSWALLKASCQDRGSFLQWFSVKNSWLRTTTTWRCMNIQETSYNDIAV